MSPISFLWASGIIFILVSLFDGISISKQHSPRMASHLKFNCLRASQGKDVRFMRVIACLKVPLNACFSGSMIRILHMFEV